MKESEIEKAICDWAKTQGIETLKLAGANDRGKSDRLFLYKGKAVFLEMKKSGAEPTVLQFRFLKKMRDQGFEADWCDNTNDGIDFLIKAYGL